MELIDWHYNHPLADIKREGDTKIMARFLIIGAGGHGKVVADILLARNEAAAGFIDADESRIHETVAGLPVLGTMNRLEHIAREHHCTAAVVAIGDNRVRLEHAREVRRAGLALASAIHPTAVIAYSAKVGQGVVICMGAAICAEAVVGDLAIINTGAVVDHECNIGPAAHVCPNATLAGRVEVGEGAFIGIGASIIQCIRLGDWSTIGAGAVVIEDIPNDTTAVGVPARILASATV